jgi:hypothetical protein
MILALRIVTGKSVPAIIAGRNIRKSSTKLSEIRPK